MQSNSVNRKVKPQKPSLWDALIRNAKVQLAEVQERERGLLTVIARFERFRDAGEPFPVEIDQKETAGTAAIAIPT